MKTSHAILIGILIASVLYIGTGCKNIPIVKGNESKQEEKQRGKVDNVEYQIGANTKEKLDNIAVLAYGTDYSLGKVNDPPKEVEVARDINQRVVSIAGSPAVEEMKKMQETIDKLTSQVALEREEGAKLLSVRDQQIQVLQLESKALKEAKDKEIQKYMRIAQETAAVADTYKLKLAEMDSWFGLGAVIYGLKKFVISSAWILGIGSVLFLVLRFAAIGSPFAASIFSIFETIASWFVRAIQIIVPKAAETAGFAAKNVFDAYKNTMKKMVDGIETLKERQKALGDSSKKFTLDELKDELSKLMNDGEKELITKTKHELGYR